MVRRLIFAVGIFALVVSPVAFAGPSGRPAADFSVDAPYVSPTRSTCGAGDDCAPPSKRIATEDHTYCVSIPYAGWWSLNTCQTQSGFDTWIAVGTTLCGEEIGWSDDGCGLQSDVVAYLEPGCYYVDVEGYMSCGEYVLAVAEASGACCVDGQCVATTLESECMATGVRWFAGESCPEYECPPCAEDEDLLEIEIFADDKPQELTWELYERDGPLVASGGPLEQPFGKYTWEICLEQAKCYDFFIYDSGGDGNYPYGYWKLYFNEVLIHEEFEFNDAWDAAHMGSGCLGACCVLDEDTYICVTTATSDECTALDGYWYDAEDCFATPPFGCPDSPADFLVTAPYTSPVRQLLQDESGNDCDLRPVKDHSYEVIIPYAGWWSLNTCQLSTDCGTWLALGTRLCENDVPHDFEECGGGCDLTAYLEPGRYFVDMESGFCSADVTYIFDIRELLPCPEDLDGDGFVGLADLATLLSNYLGSGMGPEEGDLDGDGDVDLSDLLQFLSVYGQTCPTG